MKLFVDSVRSIAKRSGVTEIADALCYFCAIIFGVLAKPPGIVWLLAIIGISNLARFILCGVWFQIPFHRDAHQWCPQKDLCYRIGVAVKTAAYAVAFVSIIMRHFTRGHIIFDVTQFIAWYIVLAVSVYEALRTLAFILHKRNPIWLSDNDNRIGYLGHSAIVCNILIAINVHIIATRCFGACSYFIGAIIPLCCILIMDAVNGYIWREHQRMTRFYGWLEVFSQKFFVIGHMIAVAIALSKTDLRLNNLKVSTAVALLVAIAIIRDIIVAIWHIAGRWRLNYVSLRSYHINLVRRIIVYCWIMLSLYTAYTNDNMMAGYTALSTLVVIVCSAINIIADTRDIENSTFEGPYY